MCTNQVSHGQKEILISLGRVHRFSVGSADIYVKRGVLDDRTLGATRSGPK